MFETQGSEARLPEDHLSAAPVSPGCRGVWHTTKGTQFPSAMAAKLEGIWSAVNSPSQGCQMLPPPSLNVPINNRPHPALTIGHRPACQLL